MIMDYNRLTFEQFQQQRNWTFNRVKNVDALNHRIAREAVDAIRESRKAGRQILIITPVGPLDYGYWAQLCNDEGISCKSLVTMNMDEYIDDKGQFISESHPLSFRQFITKTFVEKLKPELRPLPENLHFPDPVDPAKTTALIESFGGADLCFGGFGITGHFAFNDPPEPNEPCDDQQMRNSRTRCLTIMRETQTQMCMGGTNGNWDILPKRAVTLGMYELLMSKKIHLTFMRSWHAGVLRRALFGEVTGRCPGSFIQEHPNVEVTLTDLAAAVPCMNVAQATGEND
jgi:glucosamine-6-phosphate deaminase